MKQKITVTFMVEDWKQKDFEDWIMENPNYSVIGATDPRPVTAGELGFTTCRVCGCYIDPALGEFSPAETADRAGTIEEPRAPGDYDDICDVDCYA